jgi:general secretion pathway protein A
MYAPFFGLQREPFSIAPDPHFLFMSERHREALAHLLYGVGGGGGFVLLTGEIGAGKTTVCRCFLEQIPPHCTVAYIFNPQLTVPELLQTICAEFGVDVPPPEPGASGVKVPIDALNAFLLRAHAEGRSAVLIIDEAQALAPAVLEQLRLLTNLETAERKLLQIILIGQPELREMLRRPDLEQLAQRVIARYHLGPLSRDETLSYMRHRLAVAGAQAQMPFEPAALACIHNLTGGVPRRINLLADRALLGAYAHQQAKVDKGTVEQAAREIFGGAEAEPGRAGRAGRARAVGAGVALGAVLAAAAGWALWPRGEAPVMAAADPGGVPASAAAAAAAHAARSPTAAAADTEAAMVASAATSAPAAASTAAAAAAAEAQAVGSTPPAAAEDATDLLAAAHTSEATAWRDLALRWHVAIGEGDACTAAAQVRLICFRSAAGGLPIVRHLGRPGWVTLRDGDRVRWALLVGLNGQEATLQAGPQRFRLRLPALASLWRGDFATFWRAPPAWRDGADALADPALRGWIAERLAAAGVADDGDLRSRVRAYQLLQGLAPDGLAGPMTLMRLSGGADEPAIEGGT